MLRTFTRITFALLLALGLGFSVTACSGDEKKDDDKKAEKMDEKKDDKKDEGK